jgi:hypothetical protein
MSRTIRASVARTDGPPLVAVKWRLHAEASRGGVPPEMRMTLTVESAVDLHAALGEALASLDAGTRAKGNTGYGRS